MPITQLSELELLLKEKPKLFVSKDPSGNDSLMPEMSVHFVELKPGEEVKPHQHDRVEVYVFLGGEAKVMSGDDIRIIGAGDVAYSPKNTPHAIKVLGDSPLRFYALNSPPESTAPMNNAPEDAQRRFSETKQ